MPKIKIEPLLAADIAQIQTLLKSKADTDILSQLSTGNLLVKGGLGFLQHLLPQKFHFTSSIYVAKENGLILGMILVKALGKSKECWQIEHLITHPKHRGRGIAQELLHYVLALYGSQGAGQFIAEVPVDAQSVLSLFNSAGFCSCTKVIYFEGRIEPRKTLSKTFNYGFRAANTSDRRALFILNQEILPPDIRNIFSFCEADFDIFEVPIAGVENFRQKVAKNRSWFYVLADPDRNILIACAKMSQIRDGEFQMEFAVHPGHSSIAPDLSSELVNFALHTVSQMNMPVFVSVRIFEFQNSIHEALKSTTLTRSRTYCLLVKEQWIRAKYPKRLKTDKPLNINGLPNPAVNFQG